ncbi:MAG: DNA polymerase III subunit gamma/tau [Candidatus Omnitrophota bacterium]|nr:MAG: DNA polymerase III subunit gamma/tau [Candidatus Omnitrophota bacterium]
MSYLAFALKYRPRNFEEVVGQHHVVTSLRNAIAKERVHHAYLFGGPRGVGKTSLARIFAKSLNCFEGPTIHPCQKCPSCQEISRGTSLDIIEIDGASNRGIDEVRALRESVKLSPAQGRYKIYIIDEVHMLTQEAFNALLKTLEEPPLHVKFIFATTNPQRVLPTILSRCQKFQFNLLPVENIVQKLKKIVSSENLPIEESLLYAIGRAAGGSIRDAESLLDQISPVVLQDGQVADTLSFLGIIDEVTLNDALKYIVEKDLTSILDLIDAIVKGGKDVGVFLVSLIEHSRSLLLAKVSIKGFREIIDISPQTKDSILKLSDLIPTSEVLRVIDLLIEARWLSHKLNTVRIPLELALIKFAYQDKKEIPIEKRGEENKSFGSQKDSVHPPKHAIDEDNFDMEDFELEKEDFDEENIDIDETEEKPQSDNALLAEVQAKWEEILAGMQKARAALASHLSFSQPFSSQGNLVTIAFANKEAFHKEIVENSKNLEFIESIISHVMNRKVGIKFILTDDITTPSSINTEENKKSLEPKGKEDNAENSEQHNEFINQLLDKFGGRLHTDET